MTPDIIRGARNLLDMSQAELAEEVGINLQTIRRIESGEDTKASTMEAILRVFAEKGLEITENKIEKIGRKVREYHGRSGFCEFMNDVSKTVGRVGGELCVSNVDEEKFGYWLGEHKDEHKARMAAVNKNYYFKVLVQEGDDYFAGSKYAEYRWIPKEQFGAVPFYVYGDKLAFIIFKENDVDVFVIEQKEITDAQRIQFETQWINAIKPNTEGRL